MLCVDCGNEVPETIDGSCPTCFAERTTLLNAPEVVDVELCAHCRARRIGSRWQDRELDAPDDWAREDALREACGIHQRVDSPLLQFDESPEDKRHFRFVVRLDGSVSGVDVAATAESLVRQRSGVCDRCSRLAGDYYAAILQLRATDREVHPTELALAHSLAKRDLEHMQDAGNRFAFVTKDAPIHGGWDYYIGDIEAGRQVARTLKSRLGASVQETAKLVGRREGEDVYRVTFLVRIQLFAHGDFALDSRGTLVQVNAVNHGKAACHDLRGHRKTRIPESELRRLGGQELVEEAILVSQGENDLQIMDPQSFKTVDVPRPDGFVADAETVAVVRYDEILYLVPSPGKS